MYLWTINKPSFERDEKLFFHLSGDEVVADRDGVGISKVEAQNFVIIRVGIGIKWVMGGKHT